MRIPPFLVEWLNLFARWFHIFVAILWIGQTYLFTWLDGRFTEGAEEERGDGGQVWMVHSGGFYVVEKRKGLEAGRGLHWFRWEAALTWLSGLFLLVVVYYLGGAMVDPDVWDISNSTAVMIGVASLIIGWVVYDLLARSPLRSHDLAFGLVAFALVVGASYGLTHVLSGRAAYIHLGAMFGTIMAGNVWMIILPSQRRMIAALKEGKPHDQTLAARAKLRSKHNTFMVIPVVFTMISNHFPVATYGREYNWLVLSGLVLLGWVAAKLVRRA